MTPEDARWIAEDPAHRFVFPDDLAARYAAAYLEADLQAGHARRTQPHYQEPRPCAS